ncbi:MAG: hypothetical protein AAF800_00820 [Planctomycetota bacterium]
MAVLAFIASIAWVGVACGPAPSPPVSLAAETSVADESLVFPEPADTISDENRAILDPWTGEWRGEFVVYAVDGGVLTRLQVRQTYRWDGDIQRATFHETDPEGNVTTAEAANYQDAEGRLVCTVEKSGGERSLHFGRLSDGYLFWSADRPGTAETFRERVVGQGDEATYTIHGLGVYDGTPLLFHGEYARPG